MKRQRHPYFDVTTLRPGNALHEADIARSPTIHRLGAWSREIG
jgi:hypothetical protein